MSLSSNNQPRTSPRHLGTVSQTAPTQSDQLAHELANLLDGSLRHLTLAIATLKDSPPGAPLASDDDLAQRLRTVNNGMQHMSQLIRRWMNHPGTLERFAGHHRLGDCVKQAVQLLGPAAATRRIKIGVEIDSKLLDTEAGPIHPILINGLRNSIEAIDRLDDQNPHRIDITARLEDRTVVLSITDTGPGIDPSLIGSAGQLRFGVTTKTTGHGLGLELAREIIQLLGGSLDLANRSPRGAMLTARYPLPAAGTDD